MQVVILFVSTILLSLATFSASAIQISGRLLSEQGSAIKDATISVGEFTTRSDQLGNFILKLDKSDTYSISFDKAGYFKSIQSFSFYELTKNSSTNNIGDITLVAKAKNRVMLAFGGDVMMGRRYYKPYFGDEVLINDSSRLTDSQAIVEHIKPYMSLADFSVVNLETQIAEHTPNERAPKSVTFYSKPETLEALKWAGIDYVTLGNNHTYDYMDSGLNSTIQFLNEAKLPFSGAGVNQEQALKAYQTTLNNNALSLLGFVGWEGNFTPNQTAGKNKGGAAFGSEQNLIKTVNEQTASGFTPIVQYHGSQEYADGPTNVTEHRLKSALDAGAELAIAHHPHVAQGLELYQGKLLAYSMGNFIFDQFFSSTPHSFILYVWLDSGKFHRAEIVPIYLKGYQPTPATGMHRYTILKRLSVLSAQRETYIERSGGHGVITKSASVNKFGTSKAVQQSVVNAKEMSLYHLPWYQQLNKVALNNTVTKYRLGKNLINGSDFESFNTFNARERGWIYDAENYQLSDTAYSGQYSMKLNIDKNVALPVGMQAFRRVYNASSPMTVSAKIKSSHPVVAKVYWQGRKRSQKFFDALNKGKKHLVATKKFAGGSDWQSLSVDFNSPRVGYRSFRVFVEFEHQSDKKQQLLVDDFAAIEWQTPFSNLAPKLISLDDKQASYIGFEKPVSGEVLLNFQ